jgi:tetratricopeptide (TPR) repeat protein
MTMPPDPFAILRDVESLKIRSRRLRDQGRLDSAGDALRQAIRMLEQERAQREVVHLSKSEPAPQDLRDLVVQLADCYGSLAGVLRRAGELQQALDFYRKGKELEQNEAYRIKNTYNQIQWLILRVLLDPGLIAGRDEPTRQELNRALQTLRQQIATDRQQDPWAYSDVGLLQVLLGDQIAADNAWDRMDSLHPIPSVYRSGLPVLQELAKVLPDNGGLRDAVMRFAAKAGT